MSATSHLLPFTRLLESLGDAVDGRLIEVPADEHQSHLNTAPVCLPSAVARKPEGRSVSTALGAIDRLFDR
jgi:hypothetical protein